MMSSSAPVMDTTKPDLPARSRSVPYATPIWAVLSAALVLFLAFGQVPARVWRSNKLEVSWLPVRRIWQVQVQELPSVHYQWLMNGIFIVSLAVFVIGVIAGARILLADNVDVVSNPDPK